MRLHRDCFSKGYREFLLRGQRPRLRKLAGHTADPTPVGYTLMWRPLRFGASKAFPYWRLTRLAIGRVVEPFGASLCVGHPLSVDWWRPQPELGATPDSSPIVVIRFALADAGLISKDSVRTPMLRVCRHWTLGRRANQFQKWESVTELNTFWPFQEFSLENSQANRLIIR